jgi:hypothetical protein
MIGYVKEKRIRILCLTEKKQQYIEVKQLLFKYKGP